MGCDIHFFVERRVGARWESVDTWGGSKWGGVGVDVPFYDGRNYSLFAMLADVRNGYGFAGCDTGDRLEVIAPPRGLPEDLSPEVRAYYDDAWSADGHSCSWLTLQEILEWDWTQEAVLRGVIPLVEWVRCEAWGVSPDGWSGSVDGPEIATFTQEDAKRLLGDDAATVLRSAAIPAEVQERFGCARPFVAHQWKEPYYRQAQQFLSETVFRLLRVGEPCDVRCVFWFDN